MGKVKGLPILITERWARSWSQCTDSQPAGDYKSSTWLPSQPQSVTPLGMQGILIGDRGAPHHRPYKNFYHATLC